MYQSCIEGRNDESVWSELKRRDNGFVPALIRGWGINTAHKYDFFFSFFLCFFWVTARDKYRARKCWNKLIDGANGPFGPPCRLEPLLSKSYE